MFPLRHTVLVGAAALALFIGVGAGAGESSGGGDGIAASLQPIHPEQLRDINALYASPWTVNPGHAQVETYAVQYARDHDRGHSSDTTRETWTFGPMTLKAGLLDNLDVEFTFTPFTRARLQDRQARQKSLQQGFGDVFTAVKYNVRGNDGGRFAVAALPFIKFPTSQDELGNDFVEGGLIVPLACELPYGWWVILSPEADISHDVFSSGYHVDFANTVYVSHTIVGKLSGYADFYTWFSTEKHSRPVGIIDFGLTYAWSRVQIDGGVSLAVTKLGDDVNPYIGLSFRF